MNVESHKRDNYDTRVYDEKGLAENYEWSRPTRRRRMPRSSSTLRSSRA